MVLIRNSINIPDSGLDDRREISGGASQRFGASIHRYRFHWEINRSVGDRCLRTERDPSDQIQTNQRTNKCSLFGFKKKGGNRMIPWRMQDFLRTGLILIIDSTTHLYRKSIIKINR